MLKKKLLCILLIVVALLISACGNTESAKQKSRPDTSVKHRIIIDTDTAGDDALAIAMCAKASNITIEGVTVLAGNVDLEQGTKNALMTLEMAGKTEIPVFRGADTTIDGVVRKCYSVFGNDGMGDMDIIHPTGTAQDKPAEDFILETVRKYPDEIEILSIGPATNIANAINKDPETMKHVKMIWSMGTAGFGSGNATPVAEFNVYSDALAYKIMMEEDIPVTVVGLDMCGLDEVTYNKADMTSLEKTGKLGEFLVKSWTKLYEFKKEKQNRDRVDVCDGVTAAVLIWNNFATSSEMCSSYICVNNDPTYGQVIFYKENFTYDSMPAIVEYDKYVVTSINTEIFMSGVEELLR